MAAFAIPTHSADVIAVPQDVAGIEASMSTSDYAPNSAQRRLAEGVTRFVHGEEGLRQALAATEVSCRQASTSFVV
jgi:tyrosyl-tRNA synthetase